LLLLCPCWPATAQDATATIRSLFEQQRWAEVVAAAEIAEPTPDLHYYKGAALARLERWDTARQTLLHGRSLLPKDPRFPIELAGIAFKQTRYAEAARWLREARSLQPKDRYTTEFLATVYFLQGNLEAAVELWNRIGKPRIQQVRTEPAELRVDPVLLDQAFAFAPASTLLLDELRTSQARTASLGIFPTRRWELQALPNGKFDLTFTAIERNGWGANRWQAALQLLRGIGYQAVHPEYYNLGGGATNVLSMVRWDPDKRRLHTEVSGPLRRSPAWRYTLTADARDERWNLTRLAGGTPIDLQRAAAGGQAGWVNGDWSWSLGGELSHRSYGATDPPLLPEGYQLKQTAGLTRALWRNPQRRFNSALQVSSETAKIWQSPQARTFERLQIGTDSQWYPQSKGGDYAIRQQVRAGRIFGDAPLDELYILGLERDNDLYLRAHIGTRDGRKGSAPMGNRYFVANWEIDKTVYSNGLLTLQASPFLDTGRIAARAPGFAPNQWLWDIGIQAKLRVLGVGVTFVYGKDLRTGNNTFYLLSTR
jgi:tetratricopeptide (TPR) repeat protein